MWIVFMAMPDERYNLFVHRIRIFEKHIWTADNKNLYFDVKLGEETAIWNSISVIDCYKKNTQYDIKKWLLF